MTYFRSAELQDLDALNDLLYRSKKHWGYDKKFMDVFMERYPVNPQEIPHTVILGSKNASEISGFHCLLYREDHGPFLENLFINPVKIGSGLGRKMWNNVCQKAKNNQWKSFTLSADPSAESFYKHMGAKTIGSYNSPCDGDSNRKTPIMEYIL